MLCYVMVWTGLYATESTDHRMLHDVYNIAGLTAFVCHYLPGTSRRLSRCWRDAVDRRDCRVSTLLPGLTKTGSVFLYSGYKSYFVIFYRFLAFLYFYSTFNRLLQCCIKYTDIVLSIANSVLLHCYKDINYYGCFYTSLWLMSTNAMFMFCRIWTYSI